MTLVDGVYFTEGTLEGEALGQITLKAPTQNTTLAECKKLLAAKARLSGANAVTQFQYSQRADKGANLFKWDTERLNLSGMLVKIHDLPNLSE